MPCEVITAVPLYEYNCEKDGRFELIRKFSDPPVKVCPTCGRKVEKLLSSPAIQFKGTGWYITDYARKGKDGSGKDSKDSSKDSGSSESSSKADGSSKADSSSKSDSPSKSDSSPQSTPSKSTAASGSSSSK
jgi:putative FmdB family regulatory protein